MNDDNFDTEELPKDLKLTFTETIADPQCQAESSAQPASIAPAQPVIPEAAPWTSPSSKKVLSSVVLRELSSSYRVYSGFPNIDDFDEEKKTSIGKDCIGIDLVFIFIPNNLP